MSLVVSNNVASLTAQHNLFRSSSMLSKSLERLSSGYRVNRGADGPAALVISEQQRAQIAGLEKAIENTEKGVSVVQTAEGALNEINSLLVKIRSLALDSANAGVNDANSLAANQAEIDNALDTINRIANNTQFGTKKLLDGSAGITGSTTGADVNFINGTSATVGGQYAVNVTTAGERATRDPRAVQGGGLLDRRDLDHQQHQCLAEHGHDAGAGCCANQRVHVADRCDCRHRRCRWCDSRLFGWLRIGPIDQHSVRRGFRCREFRIRDNRVDR